MMMMSVVTLFDLDVLCGLVPDVLDPGRTAAEDKAEGGWSWPKRLDGEGAVVVVELTLVALGTALLVQAVSKHKKNISICMVDYIK